jgi:4-oxalocrotonate tautomerase
MPHIIVKLYPGRSEESKRSLAQKINQAVVESLDIPDDVISIAVEEIAKESWDEKVRRVDILPKQKSIYKHSRSSRSD